MNDFTKDVLSVIRSTREVSLPGWGIAEVMHKKSEAANDIVTKLDYQVEEYLTNEFAKIDSTISFVGEEYSGDREAKKHWLVDPIDGTSHYMRGLPFCTTMVALIDDGQVVFSAIYDFVNDLMYHAEKGQGAYRDGEPIHVSDRPLSSAYVGYESNLNNGTNMQTYLQVRKKMNLFNMVVAGYEFVLVATGKVEARICFDPYGKDFDFAPGSLLVSEAGGVVTNIGSDTYDFKNVNLIAANKPVHDTLTQGEGALFPVTI